MSALSHNLNSVTGTAARVSPAADGTWSVAILTIQNNSTSDTIYIGSSTVSSSSHGYVLPPGTTNAKNSVTLHITSADVVYAVSSGASTATPVITQKR